MARDTHWQERKRILQLFSELDVAQGKGSSLVPDDDDGDDDGVGDDGGDGDALFGGASSSAVPPATAASLHNDASGAQRQLPPDTLHLPPNRTAASSSSSSSSSSSITHADSSNPSRFANQIPLRLVKPPLHQSSPLPCAKVAGTDPPPQAHSSLPPPPPLQVPVPPGHQNCSAPSAYTISYCARQERALDPPPSFVTM